MLSKNRTKFVDLGSRGGELKIFFFRVKIESLGLGAGAGAGAGEGRTCYQELIGGLGGNGKDFIITIRNML